MDRIFLGIAFIFFSLSANTQAEVEKVLFKSENGFVSFVSDAPLELIRAESNSLRGLVDPEKRTFAVQVETKSLSGFNSPLQEEHFYENYIESVKFPTASFSGKIIEKIDFNKTGIQTVRAKGILNIHGEKMERIIHCDVETEPDGFTVKSNFIVRLEDHDISIPKLVYQKIAEEINVTIDAYFTNAALKE